MSNENKKYYWLKLMKDFFVQPKIKKLRRIAGGDTYTIIYLKLQLLSLESDGILYYQKIEDNFADEMALTIDEDSENVQVTLQFLLSQGLMQKLNDDEYLLTETISLIGSETSVAKRVRKYRENQKLLQCNTGVTNCNTEIDIEIEKELDKEIEKKDNKKTFSSIIDSYSDNQELKNTLHDFVEMRKKTKGYTIRALELSLMNLNKLSNDDSEKIQIINQSIENTWKGFFPLKQKKTNLNNLPDWFNNQDLANTQTENVDDEEIQKMMSKLNEEE